MPTTSSGVDFHLYSTESERNKTLCLADHDQNISASGNSSSVKFVLAFEAVHKRLPNRLLPIPRKLLPTFVVNLAYYLLRSHPAMA